MLTTPSARLNPLAPFRRCHDRWSELTRADYAQRGGVPQPEAFTLLVRLQRRGLVTSRADTRGQCQVYAITEAGQRAWAAAWLAERDAVAIQAAWQRGGRPAPLTAPRRAKA